MVIAKKSKHKLLLLRVPPEIFYVTNTCSGLGINDLVIPPSPFLMSRFIYSRHRKVLSGKANPSRESLKTSGRIHRTGFFYWATRNTVNAMTCLPVVSEVIREFNDSQREEAQPEFNSFDSSLMLSDFFRSGNFRPLMDNGQPPLFLPPHFSQFTPPLFSGIKGMRAFALGSIVSTRTMCGASESI